MNSEGPHSTPFDLFVAVTPAAGNHGQCCADRGLFSCLILQRQPRVVNLDGTCRYRRPAIPVQHHSPRSGLARRSDFGQLDTLPKDFPFPVGNISDFFVLVSKSCNIA